MMRLHGKYGNILLVSENAETAVPKTGKASTGNKNKTDAIFLHNRNAENNTPFNVSNMFLGYGEVKNHCLMVSYKCDIILRLHADIRENSEKLAEVLKVRVGLSNTDGTLFGGLMRDMLESLLHVLTTDILAQSEEVYYEICA